MANFELERIRIETEVSGLEHHASIGSTNDRGLDLLKLDASSEISVPLPYLILTDIQTAGRGQFHRHWISDMGNLTCTICALSNQQQPDSLLPLAVGLAVSEAIENVVPSSRIKLKWPNDLLIEKHKLGGILIEQNSGKLVIGIGLNVNQNIDLHATGLSQASIETPGLKRSASRAVSLKEVKGQEVDLTELTIEIVNRVLKKMTMLPYCRPLILEGCHERMIFRDREIELTLANGERMEGFYLGITDAGELLIEVQGNHVTIASAASIRW